MKSAEKGQVLPRLAVDVATIRRDKKVDEAELWNQVFLGYAKRLDTLVLAPVTNCGVAVAGELCYIRNCKNVIVLD